MRPAAERPPEARPAADRGARAPTARRRARRRRVRRRRRRDRSGCRRHGRPRGSHRDGRERHRPDTRTGAEEPARRLAERPQRMDDRARLDPEGARRGRGRCDRATGAVARPERGRRARLVPVRKPPAGVLDDVRGPLSERGGRDGIAAARASGREGRTRPADRALSAVLCLLRRQR